MARFSNKITIGTLAIVIIGGISFSSFSLASLVDAVEQSRQFTSPEANEVYKLAKNCLDENDYS